MSRELSEELEKVVIRQDQARYFKVRSQLPPLEKAESVKFLEVNIDVFAWSTYDVLGIDPGFICHQLNVNPKATPCKQPLQRSSKEHAEVVRVEVNKLK